MPSAIRRVPCELCPLRAMPRFAAFSPPELKFISGFKRGELVAEAGTLILAEGAHSAQLFTMLSGWAFRYKTLEDGRRQILNYVLPGDLVGLQGSVMGEMQHSVEALSPAVLCVFQRDNLPEMFRQHPSLGFDITWLASREERMLDENLLSLGRRTALERAAYLIAFIYQRAAAVGIIAGSRLDDPDQPAARRRYPRTLDRPYQQDAQAIGANGADPVGRSRLRSSRSRWPRRGSALGNACRGNSSADLTPLGLYVGWGVYSIAGTHCPVMAFEPRGFICS